METSHAAPLPPDLTLLWQRLDREVWIVTSAWQGRRGGLAATAVLPISLPAAEPRLLVALSPRHATTALVQSSRRLGLHLVGPAQADWVSRFGLASGREGDKFAGLDLVPDTAVPRLRDAPAWLEAAVEACWDAGDRLLFLTRVLDAAWAADPAPLTVHRYLAQASPEELAVLRQQRQRDAAEDAAAIARWRADR